MTAWTLALLGGYGMVRFPFMAIRELQEVPALPQGNPVNLAGWITQHGFGIALVHSLLCMGIVGLAIALLWRKNWSRPAMVGFCIAMALYLGAWSIYLLLIPGGEQADASAWKTIQWVIALMLMLLSATSILLARRFNGKHVRSLFDQNE